MVKIRKGIIAMLLMMILLVFVLCAAMYMGRGLIDHRHLNHLTLTNISNSYPNTLMEISKLMEQKRDLKLNFTAVIIQTHYRSGSSLTGHILQQHPDAFYLYEPLRAPFKFIATRQEMEYPDGRIKKQPMDFNNEAKAIIRSLLTCDFLNVFSEVFLDNFINIGSMSKKFTSCLREKRQKAARLKKSTPKTAKDDFLMCVKYLRNICLHSKYRMLKIVRVPMEILVDIFDNIPSLKVLHLVRDPRAVIVSRKKFGTCDKDKTTNFKYGCTNEICKRLENDISTKRILEPNYADRIKTIFYEDIARRPVDMAKEMYAFIGMPIQQNMLNHVYDITLSGKKDDCAICTVRSNSSEHIMAWKKYLDKDSLYIIQNRCNLVLKHYDYTIIS